MAQQLTNEPDNPVSVVFIPVYLSEGDGVLGMPYYEVLQGFDLAVHPSRYDPWGYAPLEDAAHAVPAITSDQAGFGVWAQKNVADEAAGVLVLPRLGRPREQTVADLTSLLQQAPLFTKCHQLFGKKTAR